MTRTVCLALVVIWVQHCYLWRGVHAWQPSRPPPRSISRKVGIWKRRYRTLDNDEGVSQASKRIPLLSVGYVINRIRYRRKNSLDDPPELTSLLQKQENDRIIGLGDKSTVTRDKSDARTTKKPATIVKNVSELRSAVLDDGIPLKDINLQQEEIASVDEAPFDHDVLKVIAHRAKMNSKPGNRDPGDHAKLALSIEGGGMRGAVSAGMAAAIASLGLCDAFDVMYGSSAGSIVGAYMVSRQVCLDVYTDVLPAARSKFVSKARILSSLMGNAANVILSGSATPSGESKIVKRIVPGMNISFVLDGIMSPETGLRPLDLKAFERNDQKQPLRVVSSVVRDGKMETVSFGSANGDFFDTVDETTGKVLQNATTRKNGNRHGLFACLEASMTVPCATGSPVDMLLQKDQRTNITSTCFDAFCFEPVPYRSAVEEGATHVLALRTRPDGFKAPSKQGFYEKAAAPIYFQSHGQEEVASFFEKGGQQYLYMEDMLTLDEAKLNTNKNGVRVPPPQILYGTHNDAACQSRADRETWKRAHLLPIVVPNHCAELNVLSQEKDQVLQAVRGGFAAAFDMLAPAIGLELDSELTGARVAELFFPVIEASNTLLHEQLNIPGQLIASDVVHKEVAAKEKVARKRDSFNSWLHKKHKHITPDSEQRDDDTIDSGSTVLVSDQPYGPHVENCPRYAARTLLACLPGLQSGSFASLAQGLHHHHNNDAVC